MDDRDRPTGWIDVTAAALAVAVARSGKLPPRRIGVWIPLGGNDASCEGDGWGFVFRKSNHVLSLPRLVMIGKVILANRWHLAVSAPIPQARELPPGRKLFSEFFGFGWIGY